MSGIQDAFEDENVQIQQIGKKDFVEETTVTKKKKTKKSNTKKKEAGMSLAEFRQEIGAENGIPGATPEAERGPDVEIFERREYHPRQQQPREDNWRRGGNSDDGQPREDNWRRGRNIGDGQQQPREDNWRRGDGQQQPRFPRERPASESDQSDNWRCRKEGDNDGKSFFERHGGQQRRPYRNYDEREERDGEHQQYQRRPYRRYDNGGDEEGAAEGGEERRPFRGGRGGGRGGRGGYRGGRGGRGGGRGGYRGGDRGEYHEQREFKSDASDNWRRKPAAAAAAETAPVEEGEGEN